MRNEKEIVEKALDTNTVEKYVVEIETSGNPLANSKVRYPTLGKLEVRNGYAHFTVKLKFQGQTRNIPFSVPLNLHQEAAK